MLNVEAGGIGIRSLSDGDAPAKFLDASDERAVDRVADLAMVALPFEIPCFGNQHRTINTGNETRSINRITTGFFLRYVARVLARSFAD